MQTAAFDYDLPTHAIAQVPVEPRDRARLLVDRGKGEAPEHRTVADLPQLVRPVTSWSSTPPGCCPPG